MPVPTDCRPFPAFVILIQVDHRLYRRVDKSKVVKLNCWPLHRHRHHGHQRARISDSLKSVVPVAVNTNVNHFGGVAGGAGANGNSIE